MAAAGAIATAAGIAGHAGGHRPGHRHDAAGTRAGVRARGAGGGAALRNAAMIAAAGSGVASGLAAAWRAGRCRVGHRDASGAALGRLEVGSRFGLWGPGLWWVGRSGGSDGLPSAALRSGTSGGGSRWIASWRWQRLRGAGSGSVPARAAPRRFGRLRRLWIWRAPGSRRPARAQVLSPALALALGLAQRLGRRRLGFGFGARRVDEHDDDRVGLHCVRVRRWVRRRQSLGVWVRGFPDPPTPGPASGWRRVRVGRLRLRRG